MSVYYVTGQGIPNTTTANDVAVNVWNPHATRRIRLLEFALYLGDFDATANWHAFFNRTSARGTPVATLTPNTANDRDNASSPPSGFVVDVGFTAGGSPAKTGGGIAMAELKPTSSATDVGAGFQTTFAHELWIPPGSGIGLAFPFASVSFAALAGHVSVVVED